MIRFLLNLPFTLVGVLVAFVSGIKISKTSFRKKPRAIIFYVHKFWWVVGYAKNARAMTIGHVVLLGPTEEEGDLEHELVHVEQYQRLPILHPLLYQYELLKNGYRNNKYEIEAYDRAGNTYKGREKLK